MARPQRCLLSKRLMIWLSSNEGVKRLSGMESRECRAQPGYLSSAWSGQVQKVSVLFAETSLWHYCQRMDACQDFYRSSPRETCPLGQVLAISERSAKFWLRSTSAFVKVSVGCKPAGALWMSVRLGEILVKESLITQDQLQKALEFQRANGGKLGSCLTKMGFITDDDITGVLSRQYGVPSINLKYYEIDPNFITFIPQHTESRYQVIQ